MKLRPKDKTAGCHNNLRRMDAAVGGNVTGGVDRSIFQDGFASVMDILFSVHKIPGFTGALGQL